MSSVISLYLILQMCKDSLSKTFQETSKQGFSALGLLFFHRTFCFCGAMQMYADKKKEGHVRHVFILSK